MRTKNRWIHAICGTGAAVCVGAVCYFASMVSPPFWTEVGIWSLLTFGFLFLSVGLILQNLWQIKIGYLSLICAVIFAAAVYLVVRYGLWEKYGSVSGLKTLLAKYGKTSAFLFIALQFLQVTVIPLPSVATTLAGVALFGVWKTFLYSTIGIVSGSMFAFWLGRRFGVKLIVWICGEKTYAKYRNAANGKDKIALITMFVFPFFPDDLLCLIAGLTDFTYQGFFTLMMIVRPLTILSVAGVLKGFTLIPFRGYGILIWFVIFAVIAAVMYVCWKNSAKIEALFHKAMQRIAKTLYLERYLQRRKAKKNKSAKALIREERKENKDAISVKENKNTAQTACRNFGKEQNILNYKE